MTKSLNNIQIILLVLFFQGYTIMAVATVAIFAIIFVISETSAEPQRNNGRNNRFRNRVNQFGPPPPVPQSARRPNNNRNNNRQNRQFNNNNNNNNVNRRPAPAGKSDILIMNYRQNFIPQYAK